jgi:hypothetical protein
MSAPEVDELRSYLPVDAVIRDGRPQIEWLKMADAIEGSQKSAIVTAYGAYFSYL